MGTLTLADLRSELRFDLRGRDDSSDPVKGVTDTRLNMWINAGLLHVTHPTVFRHRELQSTVLLTLVSGTGTYTFSPVGGVTVTALRYVSHVEAATDDFTVGRTKLFPRDEQWFQDRSRFTSGAPRDFFVRGSQVLLNPIPGTDEAGQVLVLGVWREPALLSADGDTTTLSTLWDEIVLLAARWRAELHLGYRDLAEATKLDFTGLINEYRSFEDLHAEDWSWSADVRHESAMESSP